MTTSTATNEPVELDGGGITRRALTAAPLAMALGLSCAGEPVQAAAGHAPSAGGIAGLQSLFTRYAWSYDCNDEESFLSLFTADAIVVAYPELNELYRGKEAIRGWFRFLGGLRAKEGNDWQHEAYNHHYVGDDRRCLVYSYATHFFSNRESKEMGVRSAGYFVSDCVKNGPDWNFRRFSVNHWDRTQVPWKKPLPWAGIDN